MGNTMIGILHGVGSIKVTANADSIVEPGKKSVLTDPIGKDMYLDFEDFFRDVANNAKTPITIQELLFVKDHEYTEKSETESESIYTLSGKKLKMARLQEHDTDVKRHHSFVTIDYEKHTMKSVVYEPTTGELESTTYVYFHFDKETETFRVESWMDMPDGRRESGQGWADYLGYVFLKAHLLVRRLSKVLCKSLSDAPDGSSEKIVLSSDISEYYKDPQELLDAMVTLLKKETTDVKGTVEYGDDDDSVTLISPMSTQLGPDIPPLPGTEGMKATREITIDREKLRLVSYTSVSRETEDGVEEDPEAETTWQLYLNPLRVGFWNVRPLSESKKKVASHYEAMLLSYFLNRLVGEEELLKEISGLDEKNIYF